MALFNKGKKNQTENMAPAAYADQVPEPAYADPEALKQALPEGGYDPIAAAISERRGKIAALFGEIGMSYFNSHMDDPEALEREKIEKVIALNHEIEDYEDSIKAADGLTRCRSCGRDIVLDAVFCSYCGAQVENPQKAEKFFCSVCGAVMSGGQKYCLKCGTRAKEQPQNYPGAETLSGFSFKTVAFEPEEYPEPEIRPEETAEDKAGYNGEYKEAPFNGDIPAPEKEASPDYGAYDDPDGSFETVMLFENEPAAGPAAEDAFPDEAKPEPEEAYEAEAEKAPEPLRIKNRVCARCGQKIEGDSSFCIYCGTKIKNDDDFGETELLGKEPENIFAGRQQRENNPAYEMQPENPAAYGPEPDDISVTMFAGDTQPAAYGMAEDIAPTTALFDGAPETEPLQEIEDIPPTTALFDEAPPTEPLREVEDIPPTTALFDTEPSPDDRPVRICRICGCEIDPGNDFCTLCGAKAEDDLPKRHGGFTF